MDFGEISVDALFVVVLIVVDLAFHGYLVPLFKVFAGHIIFLVKPYLAEGLEEVFQRMKKIRIFALLFCGISENHVLF